MEKQKLSAKTSINAVTIRAGQPAVILAPMEGITDAPMRAILGEMGGFTHLVSEFIRVSGTILPKKVFRKEMPESAHGFRTHDGTQVQAQLLGGDPIRVAKSAAVAVLMGSPGIDLNFGCPAPTVNRNDGGATLLKYPERLEGIVSAVRTELNRMGAHEIPVSAKLRLGWDDPSAILENVVRAEAGGAAWITIHARTKMNGYQPPAYWEWIGRARERVKVPVIANGDIWSVEDFRKCREITGSEHFMIGRSALADPWLVHRLRQELQLPVALSATHQAVGTSETALPAHNDLSAWLPMLRRFADFSAEYAKYKNSVTKQDSRYCARRVKQWLRYSESTWKTDWFSRVKRLDTLEEIFAELERVAGDPSFTAGLTTGLFQNSSAVSEAVSESMA